MPRRVSPLAWLRAGLALALMLVAVLPHATLAAGFGHEGRAVAPQASAHHDAAKPCHEQEQKQRSAHERPACCILGCGLIATVPLAVTAALPAFRSEVAVPTPLAPASWRPEPAEKPPRRAG